MAESKSAALPLGDAPPEPRWRRDAPDHSVAPGEPQQRHARDRRPRRRSGAGPFSRAGVFRSGASFSRAARLLSRGQASLARPGFSRAARLLSRGQASLARRQASLAWRWSWPGAPRAHRSAGSFTLAHHTPDALACQTRLHARRACMPGGAAAFCRHDLAS